MPLEKDSFWDRGNAVMDSQLDPSQYHNPAEEILPISKQSMASVLPPGVWGAQGTVIRRSTMDGAPIGWDPFEVATRVNVDPDIPGQGFVIDPRQIQKDAALKAVKDAGVRHASTVEDLRFAGARAYQQFAISNVPDTPAMTARERPREAPIALPGVYVVPKATEGGGQEVPTANEHVNDIVSGYDLAQGVATGRNDQPSAKQPQEPATVPQAPAPPPQSPPPVPQGPPQPQPQQAVYAAPPQPAPAAPAAPVAPVGAPMPAPSLFGPCGPTGETPAAAGPSAPSYKVTFEVRGAPAAIEAWYHEIVKDNQVLVMCYDTRTHGYPRINLMPTEEDIAIHLDGSDMVYDVTDPAIKFVHGHDELQIFLIKRERPLPGAVVDSTPQAVVADGQHNIVGLQ